MCMCSARRVARALVVLLCWSVVSLAATPPAPQDPSSPLPVAAAGRDISALLGMPSIVDGSQSHDPGGRLITFRWTITEAPHGSVATLDASDPAPTFVADLPGTYVLQLVVTNEDGVESRPASVSLVAFATRPFPNARAGKDRQVRVGTGVDLDARMSYDLLRTPLTFHWSFVSVPMASGLGDGDIISPNSAEPWFTPDSKVRMCSVSKPTTGRIFPRIASP